MGLIDSTFVFIVLSVWKVVLIWGSQGPIIMEVKVETNIPETGFPHFFCVYLKEKTFEVQHNFTHEKIIYAA